MTMNFTEVTIEDSADIFDALEDRTRADAAGSTIHQGHHPDHGNLTLIYTGADAAIVISAKEGAAPTPAPEFIEDEAA